MNQNRPLSTRTSAHRGFSLVELLVSLVIGLVVTLAISTVMINNEGSKRSTTSVNDMNQAGVYSTYILDRVIRSAGSGYSQNWNATYGCTISASKGGTAILPRPTAWTSFPQLQQSLILAPVLIGKGQADTAGASGQVRGDLITVMGGTGAFAEQPQLVQAITVSPPTVTVPNNVIYRTGDLVLLADSAVSQGCLLNQIGSIPLSPGATTPQPLSNGPGAMSLSGSYSASSSGTVNLSAFGATSYLIPLGNVLTNNPPEFQTFGVSDNNVLTSYDLLQYTNGNTALNADAPVQLSEGVVEMRALYGIDTGINPPHGRVDQWVNPVATSGYEISVLQNTSGNLAAVQAKLRSIVAIRIGLILRTSLPEKNPIPQATTLTLFSDLPAAVWQTRTLSASELNYRFKTVEVTIPLRNVLLAP